MGGQPMLPKALRLPVQPSQAAMARNGTGISPASRFERKTARHEAGSSRFRRRSCQARCQPIAQTPAKAGELPKPGSRVMTENGCGRVISVDPTTMSVTVQFADGTTSSLSADDVEPGCGGCEGDGQS